MTFRKNALLFYESQICYFVFGLMSCMIIPFWGLGWALVLAALFVVLLLINPKLHCELITINELGISCHKAGKQLWYFEWHNIVKLQRSSRFRMPSIEIILKNTPIMQNSIYSSDYYFQMGIAAKKAIEQYYTPWKGTQS